MSCRERGRIMHSAAKNVVTSVQSEKRIDGWPVVAFEYSCGILNKQDKSSFVPLFFQMVFKTKTKSQPQTVILTKY